MARILFLAHRFPYPPNKGDKIRSWNMLRWLVREHEVHLGAFLDDPDDLVHVKTVEKQVASTCLPTINPRLRRLASLAGFLTGQPLSVAFYRHAQLQAYVDNLVVQGAIDCVVVFSGAMARFVLPHVDKVPFIMDFVDVDSDKWAQYARAKNWPMSLLYGYEARALSRFEARVAAQAIANFLVTPDEATLFQRLVPEAAKKTHCLANGVDADYFSPASTLQKPAQFGDLSVCFTGAMDYWANVDAVSWFADKVWPRVLEDVPDARFFIVGGNPAREVSALASRPGIIVTGRVPDVRPYIAHSNCVVAPMRIARGVQNKVLEGMAMAKPVITTAMGYEGIAATPRADLIVADDAQAFAQSVLDALHNRLAPAMGARARAVIEKNYSWHANLSPLGGWIDAALEGQAEPAVTAQTGGTRDVA